MTGRHAGRRGLPWFEWAAVVLAAGIILVIGLCTLAALREPTPAATREVTVTVPGPTTTVSYLILRTVTPGVDGF